MLRFLKAIKIKVLCDRLVEIQYYDASKRLKTLNFGMEDKFGWNFLNIYIYIYKYIMIKQILKSIISKQFIKLI